MAQTRKSAKKATSTKKKTSARKATATRKTTKKTSTRAAPKKKTSTTRKAQTAAKKTAAKKTAATPAKAAAPASKRKAKKAANPADLPELALVRGLADIAQSYGIDEITYDTPDLTVTMKRSSGAGGEIAAAAMAAAPAVAPPAMASVLTLPTSAPAPVLIPSPPHSPPPEPGTFLERSSAVSDEEHHIIKSPFVGTFYRRPTPEADTYVTLGSRVSKGQVLCIIEAMKLMNEIECDISGTVADILVEDAQPVEYGQSLFKIVPS